MLVVKIVLVLSLADVFFYCEELEKGTAAKAMIDGLPVPHHQLAYHYYEGGGFVISHLKAAAFLLVGENLASTASVQEALTAALVFTDAPRVDEAVAAVSAAIASCGHDPLPAQLSGASR